MKRRSFINNLAFSAAASVLASACGIPNKKKEKKLVSADRKADNNSIIEPKREIEITDTADVLVVGGGPSGVAAAIAASRVGARTILIERYNHLGGLWTGGLVLPLYSTHGVHPNGKRLKTLHGIGGEIVYELNKLDATIKEISPVIDPEAGKYVLEKMVKEAGVIMYYHCWAANVLAENSEIKAVILETKSGRLAIKAKVVVDCTGDGDIFHLAGEEYDIMNFEIGLVHRLGNIDRINKTKPGFKDLKVGRETPIPGVNWVNMHGGEFENALDFKILSQLQQKHRIDIWNQYQEIKNTPGYEKVYLVDTASQQGVRMSRILKGRYQLTLTESMTYKEFDDAIGVSGGWMSLLYNGKRIQSYERPMWQIPYSSLVPKKNKNLLVAGRCFSFEKDLFEDTRVIGTCLITGHGAGVAAAIAAKDKVAVSEVEVPKLHAILKEQNVYFG